MPILFHTKRQFLVKLPVGILVGATAAFLPAIIGLVGSEISELVTGSKCNEANCIWMVIPWLSLVSIPVGGIAIAIWIAIGIIDGIMAILKSRG